MPYKRHLTLPILMLFDYRNISILGTTMKEGMECQSRIIKP